jgi:hypothetical protein
MARPKKSEFDQRLRWDALYLTKAERAEVEAAALVANLSPGRYLYACHQGQLPVRAGQKARAVAALIEASRHLEAIATGTVDVASAFDALRITSQLLSIERHFRRAVLALPSTTSAIDLEGGPEE